MAEALGRGKGSGMVVLGAAAEDSGCFFVNSEAVGARGTGFCNIGATGLGTSGKGATFGSTGLTWEAIATGSEGVGLLEDQ